MRAKALAILAKLQRFCHILCAMWRTRARRCTYCSDTYYPPQALARDQALPLEPPHLNIQGLCPECRNAIPQRMGGYCPLCGAMYAHENMPCVPCPYCLKEPPPWKRLLFYGPYEGILRKIIHNAKFKLNSPHLGLAGELLCLAARPVWHEHIDAIVPVPLHISRLRKRGGNQCVEMSRPLSTLLGVPIRWELLRRVRKTPHQVGLDAKERARNLDNAFEADPACKGLHVLLVDDVMTTGTTLRRCAEALQRAGVGSVTVLVVGRVKPH